MRPRTSLCTLPDELLGDIFSKLPSSYILPPINRQLLPFHYSQLFRNVVLNLNNVREFYALMQEQGNLRQYTESLTYDFPPYPMFPYEIPQRENFDFFLTSLIQLKRIKVNVADTVAEAYRPTRDDFDQNPRLESFSIRSLSNHLPRDPNLPETDVFSTRAMRSIDPYDVVPNDYLPTRDSSVRDYRLEVERGEDAGNYRIRTSSSFADGPGLSDWLKSVSITDFHSVSLAHSIYNVSSLRLLGYPQLLTRLSIFSFNVVDPSNTVIENYLSSFPNITHLSIGGTSLIDSTGFFDHLRPLPLVSLHILPQTSLTIQHVIDLFTSKTKPNPSTLKIFLLDNLNCEYPDANIEYPDLGDFVLPCWTDKCLPHKVEELRDLLRKLGIETRGSTFEGLDITDSVVYEKAIIREESKCDSEMYDSEEEEEEGSEGELNSEEEEDMEAYCMNKLQDEHDEQCECGDHWFECTTGKYDIARDDFET